MNELFFINIIDLVRQEPPGVSTVRKHLSPPLSGGCKGAFVSRHVSGRDMVKIAVGEFSTI